MPGAVYDEECIYKLITPARPPVLKQPLYKSKHVGRVNPRAMELGVKDVRQAATFGRPLGSYIEEPQEYLKKHAKEPDLPRPSPPSVEKVRRKAPIPDRKQPPLLGQSKGCNYVVANAVNVIRADPKKPPPPPTSWTAKPGMGEVPKYLAGAKERIRKEKEQLAAFLQIQHQQEKEAHVVQMPEEERQELLRALKSKWGAVNSAYQRLPFSLDTPAKKKRKEAYERQLNVIEKDIHTLSRSATVLVLQDF
eukprot:jgi/Botrbrau1/1075/Bobra.0076s0040.1